MFKVGHVIEVRKNFYPFARGQIFVVKDVGNDGLVVVELDGHKWCITFEHVKDGYVAIIGHREPVKEPFESSVPPNLIFGVEREYPPSDARTYIKILKSRKPNSTKIEVEPEVLNDILHRLEKLEIDNRGIRSRVKALENACTKPSKKYWWKP